jgi:mono/diheme cytochrome c family protein
LQRLKRELGDEYNKPVPAASKEQLVSGKKIFTKYCIACHGESGKGDGPAAVGFMQKPADFTDTEHLKYYSDQGRLYIIKKGIADTPMSSWEGVLREKEIQSVSAYIRSLRGPVN